ncbi:TerB N-terminal domain-containing protein [Paraburkholderia saeva]|uniref:TerB N-terminal domain-containing protein n=1 Tax=Paraburkholderia saeva TaxID=2777537 RepID=UPI001D9BC478|nr:TerB N-terminal domain-containing protein [Paraburkholderia saeva]CAG4911635.1 hypothetical protein R52603_03946 [Paraburkholderia saeva]
MGLLRWLLGRRGNTEQRRQEQKSAREVRGTNAVTSADADSRKQKPAIPSTRGSRAVEPVFKIPPHRRELLFISDADPPISTALMSLVMTADGSLEQSTDDPSTIYVKLPVNHNRPGDIVPKMGYFPSYARMTPEQRWLYLSWLRDVTAPIDIGYVFVYYYGLERHLVHGDFEGAIEEILLLRKHHNQGSFNAYSSAALVHSCLMRKRADVLMRLYQEHGLDYFENSSLLLLHAQGLDLTPDMLLRLVLITQIEGVTKKYVKENIDLFRESLMAILHEDFGRDSYPFAGKYDMSKVKGISYAIFANISLAPEVRTPALPNLLHHKPFVDEVGSFFRRVHEETKRRKAAARKAARLSSGDPIPKLTDE